MGALRMSAEHRFRTALRREFALGEETLVCQQRVEGEAAVAFAQDTAVPLRPVRLLRPDPQDVVVKDPEDFDQRQGGPNMATTATLERVDDQLPQIARPLVEADRETRLRQWRHHIISEQSRVSW